jgi:hypothetical protein
MIAPSCALHRKFDRQSFDRELFHQLELLFEGTISDSGYYPPMMPVAPFPQPVCKQEHFTGVACSHHM